MAGTKRTLHATLGWIVWKVLAIVGLPMAKKKIAEGGSSGRRSRR